MLIRPLLRYLDVRRSNDSKDQRIRRNVGLGALVEYTVSEVLDRSRYLYGSYEYVYASAFVAQIAPGSTVVDVGANIGEYTLLAAVATGQDGLVFSVEPNLGLHHRIIRNLDLNGFSNVRLMPVALGSSAGSGTLTVPIEGPALGTLRDTAAGNGSDRLEVPIRRLDDVVGPPSRQRLSVVKVDVEGWELEVLRGAQETLAQAKPVVLYECGGEQFQTVDGRRLTPSMAYLEALGYRNYTVRMDGAGNWHLRPVDRFSDPLAEREPWSVLMVVAVHPETRHAVMGGQSLLPRCGIFELLARVPSPVTGG
jgi:FkbM family methyltransferase